MSQCSRVRFSELCCAKIRDEARGFARAPLKCCKDIRFGPSGLTHIMIGCCEIYLAAEIL